MAKAAIPKGTRDFGPAQMLGRNFIFNTLKGVFQTYGFQPIETPAMERLETLTGKYGEEGDRLIFKILARGEKLNKGINALTSNSETPLSVLSEDALRYDLTVPFARFVVQHRNDLVFPFKRYQIQPVWRADRPQKGRYREFYQCDVDMIGSTSLLNEVELIQLVNSGFAKLGLADVTIRVNNRKILAGLAEVANQAGNFGTITVAIDKLDKIGIEGVEKELVEKGIPTAAIAKIKSVLELQGVADLAQMRAILEGSEIGQKGLDELDFMLKAAKDLGVDNAVPDFTLARGLDYYTGAIFEVTHNEFNSSICGGGRYDDLTGVFGLKDMSGVGISFGADRIYDLMLAKGLFPKHTQDSTQLLFVNFGDQEAAYVMKLLKEIRSQNINAELYPDKSKMKKQMKYANDKGIPFVAMVGENEMNSGMIQLKNMETGDQVSLSLEELVKEIKK
ncbi:histidine--tRNA ligase [bacterium SCSIO 12643]|nr:histidine--tRNA ligase [bacterium SCSIO 12643]